MVKPSRCFGCPLHKEGAGFARTDGDGTQRVLVVAEALGGTEASAGKPLVGPAGKTWDRILSRTTDPVLKRPLQRSDFLHDNVLHCQPPGNILVGAPYEFPAIDACRGYLEETLRSFKPRAIITLGNVPLRWFTGEWGIEQLRGYVFSSPWGPVIPTYHPSYIMRGKWNLARVVQLDVLKALDVARRGPAALHVEKAYELSPSWGELAAFVDGWRKAGKPPLAFDIETPKAGEAADSEDMIFEDDASYQILMISLAYEPFKAISIPWIEPFVSLVKEVFAEKADFLVWNAKFDVPRLMASGVHFGGRVIDAMLAWHWLEPALPMGLKYVATFFCPDMGAWKLDMHKNFAWYNAADSDVLLRVFLEIRERLTSQGRWSTFERHFLDFGQILMKMTERGVTVDHVARKTARDHFSARFDQVAAKADSLAPAEVKKVHPKRGYKKTPEVTEGLVQIEVELTEQEVAAKRKRYESDRKKAEERKAKEARKAERERKKLQREQEKRDRALAREAKKAGRGKK